MTEISREAVEKLASACITARVRLDDRHGWEKDTLDKASSMFNAIHAKLARDGDLREHATFTQGVMAAAETVRRYGHGAPHATRHHFSALESRLRSMAPVPDSDPVPTWVSSCVKCGRIVDTREAEDGGDTHGSQLSDGQWVCSSECWGAAIGEGQADPVPQAGDAALEAALLALPLAVRGAIGRVEMRRILNAAGHGPAGGPP